jgi:hypothetical protein
MPENLLPKVNRVELDRVSNLTQAGLAHSSSPVAAAGQSLTPGAVTMQADNSFKNKADVKQGKKDSNPQPNLSLKFKIDEKTKDVTILMIDRETHKVVRSIPPEEMSKMDPGELLELFT